MQSRKYAVKETEGESEINYPRTKASVPINVRSLLYVIYSIYIYRYKKHKRKIECMCRKNKSAKKGKKMYILKVSRCFNNFLYSQYYVFDEPGIN